MFKRLNNRHIKWILTSNSEGSLKGVSLNKWPYHDKPTLLDILSWDEF